MEGGKKAFLSVELKLNCNCKREKKKNPHLIAALKVIVHRGKHFQLLIPDEFNFPLEIIR